MSQIKQDLIEYFPYKVVGYERAEADDIIGVLTKYFQENETITQGLEEEPQKILILSSDRDNLQLQKYKNVAQWSPMQKKVVKPETTAHNALIEKICCGDPGDGYANIMSPDDVFVDPDKRQKPFKKSRLPEFYEKGIDACKTDEERRNYQRNEMLASYDKIPADVEKAILDTYKTTEIKDNRRKIMEYLTAHNCRNLMSSIEDF